MSLNNKRRRRVQGYEKCICVIPGHSPRRRCYRSWEQRGLTPSASNITPVLAITPDESGSNTWNITVTNPMPGHVYRIEKRGQLNDAAGWQFHVQTTSNFSVTPLANSSQFFRAILLTQALPDIVSFNINPATLSSNGPATLNWSVNGATGVTLDHGIGDVTGTTSRLVSITGTRTYTLAASNSVGSVTGLATVVVGQLPINNERPGYTRHYFADERTTFFCPGHGACVRRGLRPGHPDEFSERRPGRQCVASGFSRGQPGGPKHGRIGGRVLGFSRHAYEPGGGLAYSENARLLHERRIRRSFSTATR